jgi:hypothetical protein
MATKINETRSKNVSAPCGNKRAVARCKHFSRTLDGSILIDLVLLIRSRLRLVRIVTIGCVCVCVGGGLYHCVTMVNISGRHCNQNELPYNTPSSLNAHLTGYDVRRCPMSNKANESF